MARYIKDNFKNLKFNAFDLIEKDDIFKKFPEIELHEEFEVNLGVDKALLFKWLCYTYDPKSPLVKIEEIRKRSVTAAVEAGFPIKRGKFADKYMDVVVFSRDVRLRLGRMIIKFCRITGGAEYSQLAVYQNMMAINNSDLLSTELTPGEQKTLLAVQNDLLDSISKIRSKFLSGDDSSVMAEELHITIEEELLEFTPEKIALNTKIREHILKASPYAKWKYRAYKKSDLTAKEKKELEAELANDTPEARRHFKAIKK